ncbi:MAG: glyoxalase [Sphingomonadales bacterium]|nr:glyoxalase [Sphingomonadales bacterium]
MTRSHALRSLRSEIPTDSTRSPLPMEHFQNEVIRPILKFQNDAFVSYFKAHIGDATLPQKPATLEAFIKTRLQKDLTLRNTCLGLTIGLLTTEELPFYFEHKTELNKRIIQMLCQRLIDQL